MVKTVRRGIIEGRRNDDCQMATADAVQLFDQHVNVPRENVEQDFGHHNQVEEVVVIGGRGPLPCQAVHEAVGIAGPHTGCLGAGSVNLRAGAVVGVNFGDTRPQRKQLSRTASKIKEALRTKIRHQSPEEVELRLAVMAVAGRVGVGTVGFPAARLPVLIGIV